MSSTADSLSDLPNITTDIPISSDWIRNDEEDGPIASSNSIFIRPHYRVLFPIATTLHVGGILSNLLTIICFIKFQNLRKPTFYHVLNIAVTDLLSSLGAIHFEMNHTFVFGKKFGMENRYYCLLSMYRAHLFLWASLGGIALISIDRVVAVTWPLKHIRILTLRNTVIMITIQWIIIIISPAPPLLIWNVWKPGMPCLAYFIYPAAYQKSVYMGTPIAFLLWVMAMNIYIGTVAYGRRKQIQLGDETIPNPKHQQEIKQFKVTKMLLTVVGIFFLTWIPFVILSIILVNNMLQRIPITDNLLGAYDISLIILLLSFNTNSFIWASQNRAIYEAYKRILTCK